jgi:hypothetical protein
MQVKSQFRHHLDYHSARTGFAAPDALLDYLAELLASRLERTDLIPDPSFAERYLLLLQAPRAAPMQDFADSCLFFTSLMPEYGQRRGISMDYYCTLGIASYYTVSDLVADDRFTQLGNWFYTLQRFLNTAIHPELRLELFKF